MRKRSRAKQSKASQMVAKLGLTLRGIMVRIWWDLKGIVKPFNQMIDFNLYSDQIIP